jgi:hypothetical protein
MFSIRLSWYHVPLYSGGDACDVQTPLEVEVRIVPMMDAETDPVIPTRARDRVSAVR